MHRQRNFFLIPAYNNYLVNIFFLSQCGRSEFCYILANRETLIKVAWDSFGTFGLIRQI